MGRTCGEPDEIELTPMGVTLNGSGHVHDRVHALRGLAGECRPPHQPRVRVNATVPRGHRRLSFRNARYSFFPAVPKYTGVRGDRSVLYMCPAVIML